ncbi:MAG: helix-hairpin-helix domain-containing protein [Pirellulales bacterium]
MRKSDPARQRWTWVWRRVDRQVIAALTAGAALALGLGAAVQRLSPVPAPADHSPLLFQLDIHSAPWTEWALLPGIGEGLAKRICDQRNAQGGFQSLDDVRRVRGIGPKTWERMKAHLKSSRPASSPPASEQGT